MPRPNRTPIIAVRRNINTSPWLPEFRSRNRIVSPGAGINWEELCAAIFAAVFGVKRKTFV
jgi:hypothetical protein